MKKLFLTLALALPMLLTFSSCSSDKDEPVKDEYMYEVNLTNISMDLTDFYDLWLTFTTGTGIQQSYTITSRDMIPDGRLTWRYFLEPLTTLNWKVELRPKMDRSMDDATDYTVSITCEASISMGDNIYGTSDETFGGTKTGAQWKTKGTFDLEGTITPSK